MTRHDRVAGLGNPEGSQRALNMLFALRTIQPVSYTHLLEKRARIKEADLSEGKQMDFYGGGKRCV